MAEYRVVVPTLANCARCQIAKGTDGRVIPLTRQSKLPGATGEHNWIYHYYKVTPDGKELFDSVNYVLPAVKNMIYSNQLHQLKQTNYYLLITVLCFLLSYCFNTYYQHVIRVISNVFNNYFLPPEYKNGTSYIEIYNIIRIKLKTLLFL